MLPLDRIDQWRQQASSYMTSSTDPLVPVISKALEGVAVALDPPSHDTRHLARTLASFKNEGVLSLAYDGSVHDPGRHLTYGLLECVHILLSERVDGQAAAAAAAAATAHLQEDWESAGFEIPEYSESVSTFGMFEKEEDQHRAGGGDDKGIVKRERRMRISEEKKEYKNSKEKKSCLKGIKKEDIRHSRSSGRPTRVGARRIDYAKLNNGVIEEQKDVKKLKFHGTNGKTKDAEERGVNGEDDREDSGDATPQCLLCEVRPASIYAFSQHLNGQHSTTLDKEGYWIECECGLVLTSKLTYVDHRNHLQKCAGCSFVVKKVRELDVMRWKNEKASLPFAL